MYKIAILAVSLCSLSSCSNHYHDGQYSTNVVNASWTWAMKERVQINGDKLIYTAHSITDNSVLSELKTKCTQYKDRVEFVGKDNITIIARVDADGNLKYGEYTYKKMSEEDILADTVVVRKPNAPVKLLEDGSGVIDLR